MNVSIDWPYRIGSVPYLNARPLIQGLPLPPLLLPPAALADRLHQGELDAALVPVAECLVHPEYDLVDGVAIASLDTVQSVIFLSERPRESWQTVSLDPDSRSSAWLTRVLFEKIWRQPVQYVTAPTQADARLLIGDPARAFRRDFPTTPVIDLAQAWKQATSLPCVFAVWALRPPKSSRGLANYLREIAGTGLAKRRELAENEEEYEYLTTHLSYRLGMAEKQSIQLFSEYLVELRLLPTVPILRWI